MSKRWYTRPLSPLAGSAGGGIRGNGVRLQPLKILYRAFAEVFVTDNFDSGWIDSDGGHLAGNTNYATGLMSPTITVADYFSFSLAGLSGAVSSASVNIAAYTISAPGTLDLYATSLNPAQVNSSLNFVSVADYNAIVSSPVIGTVELTPRSE